jgi:hypothetical protein
MLKKIHNVFDTVNNKLKYLLKILTFPLISLTVTRTRTHASLHSLPANQKEVFFFFFFQQWYMFLLSWIKRPSFYVQQRKKKREEKARSGTTTKGKRVRKAYPSLDILWRWCFVRRGLSAVYCGCGHGGVQTVQCMWVCGIRWFVLSIHNMASREGVADPSSERSTVWRRGRIKVWERGDSTFGGNFFWVMR